jgi:hypothetical protein
VEEAAETTRRGREEVEVEWTLLLHIPLSGADFGDKTGKIALKPLYAEIYNSFAARRPCGASGWMANFHQVGRVVLTITPTRWAEIQGRRK